MYNVKNEIVCIHVYATMCDGQNECVCMHLCHVCMVFRMGVCVSMCHMNA